MPIIQLTRVAKYNLPIACTEIPGSSMKLTTPMAKKEDYKYSTSLQGPDNQFGSAERSDDEDEGETATETEKQANKLQVNSTRNRTSYTPTISIHEQKLSNKVRKIINKFEMDGELGANSNFVSCSVLLVYIPSVVLITVFVLGQT